MEYGPPTNPGNSPLFRYRDLATSSSAPPARRGHPVMRWFCAIVALLFGGALLLVALAMFLGAQDSNQRGPRVVKADELRKLQDPSSLPDPWVSYTAPKVIDTNIVVRLGRKRNSAVRYLLLKVEDRWLLARVQPRHTGNKVEGSLTVLSGPNFDRVSKEVYMLAPAKASKLLPYHLDGQYDYGVNGRTMMIVAGFVALFGAMIGWAGLKMTRAEP